METIALKLAGMSIFDAVCHCFATIATAEFLLKMIRPNTVYVARYIGQPLSSDITSGIIGFIFIYYATTVVGTLVMMV